MMLMEIISPFFFRIFMNIFSIFFEASLFVKIVMIALFSLSLTSWYIFFWRSNYLKGEINRLKEIAAICTKKGPKSLKSSLPDSPLGKMFIEMYDAANELHQYHCAETVSFHKEFVETVRSFLIEEYSKKVRIRLTVLATISSISPYIGLLGTVWGILDVFNHLEGVKVVTLQTVAPGIAEALVATAIGLITTIPAYVFFNALTQKSAALISSVNKFSEILVSTVNKEIASGGKQ